MRHLLTPIKILFALTLTLGCAHRTAENFYADGDYYAAAETYVNILRRDPEDAKAIENLRKVQQKLLEVELIEARQLRLSENYEGSHKKLKDIIKKESAWNISPTGATFSAQKEEIEYFLEWNTKTMHHYLKDGKFLKAKLLWEENQPYFLATDFISNYNRLGTLVMNRGSDHCTSYANQVKGFYSQNFWTHYCVYWGSPNKLFKAQSSAPFKHYRAIEIKGDISGIDPEVVQSLSQFLLEGLKDTPYYSDKGETLRVDVSGGTFVSSYNEVATHGIHNYNEDEPYTVNERESYEESEPYTAYKSEYDAILQKNVSVPYTAYRLVTKFRNVTRTKFRSVAKQALYPKTDFTAHYKLTGSLRFKIDGTNFSLPINHEFSTQDSFYEAYNPQIGLYSKPKQLITQMEWVKKNWQTLNRETEKNVLEAWNKKYCADLKNQSASQQMEFVMKCASGSHASVVDIWSNDFFGMPLGKVKQAVGIF